MVDLAVQGEQLDSILKVFVNLSWILWLPRAIMLQKKVKCILSPINNYKIGNDQLKENYNAWL